MPGVTGADKVPGRREAVNDGRKQRYRRARIAMALVDGLCMARGM